MSDIERTDSGLLQDPHHIRADARLVKSAIKRWAIPESIKEKLIERIDVALKDCDRRELAALGTLVLTMERQNQDDEHLADKNERLDSGKLTENAGLIFNIERVDKPPETET